MTRAAGSRLLRAHREHVASNHAEADARCQKIEASFTLDFDAPLDAEAWDLVRSVTTSAALELGRRGCGNIRPEIVGAFANGKKVRFQPKRGAR